MRVISFHFKRGVLFLLKFYQNNISPNLVRILGNSCRFTPTCSEYTYQAVEKYGVLTGLTKGMIRIVRCNPFSKGGYDPV